MSLSDVIVAGPLPRRSFFRRGPWHALAALVGWVAAIACASLILSGILITGSFFLVGMGMGLRVVEDVPAGLIDLYAPEHSAALVWCVLLALTFQWLAMLRVGLRLARVSGYGNTAEGAGNRPLRHPLAMVALAVGMCAVAAAWTSGGWTGDVTPRLPALLRLVDDTRGVADLGFGWHWHLAEIVLILEIVLLAPVAEELFFRGWIWTELSRKWSAPGVMLATALPFLLLHGVTDVGRVLVLLPVTALLTLARHFGGGIRASLLCHVFYNAGVCAAVLVLWDPMGTP
ncbi:hypothetical protein GCM10007301_02280 [Azorhizobium oxalatiphilum]|uniref:CAAX prenyl protease 2/Lysostaphin resistance protein A-like domain-containing protein n=1 Tax=Azorhizobium oxalatiphilum TaxID=980631 RepID=A0A917BI21_9HYPH|nr:CPBP family intramembrane glutamic endopeptidase [Azorhizobium oxalatiphilum]GGF46318.1 hypothetical protein GCM10007301_02280 [Azorhizobium oxalatiphilum]